MIERFQGKLDTMPSDEKKKRKQRLSAAAAKIADLGEGSDVTIVSPIVPSCTIVSACTRGHCFACTLPTALLAHPAAE